MFRQRGRSVHSNPLRSACWLLPLCSSSLPDSTASVHSVLRPSMPGDYSAPVFSASVLFRRRSYVPNVNAYGKVGRWHNSRIPLLTHFYPCSHSDLYTYSRDQRDGARAARRAQEMQRMVLGVDTITGVSHHDSILVAAFANVTDVLRGIDSTHSHAHTVLLEPTFQSQRRKNAKNAAVRFLHAQTSSMPCLCTQRASQ